MHLHDFDIKFRICREKAFEHREKIFEGLHREPIEDKGGPFSLHEQQCWGGRLGEKGDERTESCGRARLTGAVIDAGAGERDGAKERAEGPDVLAFGAKRGPTRVTARVRGQRCGHLPGQQALLKMRQARLGSEQGQTEMLKPFGLLLQDNHVLDSGLVIVIGMEDEL